MKWFIHQVIPAKFWGTSLWQTVATCVLAPGDLGFNMTDVEIMKNLPQQVGKINNLFELC